MMDVTDDLSLEFGAVEFHRAVTDADDEFSDFKVWISGEGLNFFSIAEIEMDDIGFRV